MANELKYLVIHCADTPPYFNITKTILEQWHKGPKDIYTQAGKLTGVKYLGHLYPYRDNLPRHIIGGVLVQDLKGRGWDRLGYSDLIHRDGKIENLTPYDNDHLVQSHEVTWGVTGVNAFSRHVCLEGGRDYDNLSTVFEFDEIFTDSQFTTLIGYVRQFLKDQPQAKVTGHSAFSDTKTCPNFNVSRIMLLAGIPKNRIHVKQL